MTTLAKYCKSKVLLSFPCTEASYIDRMKAVGFTGRDLGGRKISACLVDLPHL